MGITLRAVRSLELDVSEGANFFERSCAENKKVKILSYLFDKQVTKIVTRYPPQEV
jgi:hypothetical protein